MICVDTPLSPKAKGTLQRHIAMVEYTDFLLKKIVDKLQQEKLDNNTIIVWTTDNGRAFSSA